MSDFFSGGSGKVTQTSAVDPTQNQLNELFTQEALGLRGVSGGVPAFGSPQPGLYGLGPTEDLFRRQIISATSDPGAYPQVLQSLFGQTNRLSNYAGEQMDWGVAPTASPIDLESINYIRSLLDQATQGPSPLERGALGTYAGRTDPTALLDAASRYMREIGEPTARAASVAGGMGGVRGGAFQEGLARESARLAIPILELVNRSAGEFGAAQERIGGGLEARRAGLAGGLFNLGTGLESRSLARRGLAGQMAGQAETGMQNFARLLPMFDQTRLAMLTAGAGAAAKPRELALQDFLRQQDLVMSTLLRTPVKTGGTTTGQERTDLTVKDFIGPLASVWAANLLGS